MEKNPDDQCEERLFRSIAGSLDLADRHGSGERREPLEIIPYGGEAVESLRCTDQKVRARRFAAEKMHFGNSKC